MRFRQEIQALPRETLIARIRVAAGILRDKEGRVLIAQRTGEDSFTGLWEFPGGKIRDDEESLSALRRELDEELGVRILGQTLFVSLDHDYPDRSVSIDFYLIDEWANTPEGKDGQDLTWIRPDALAENMVLPADGPVLEALRRLASSADA
ncbi:MAG: 8-oxo-dGTP diphosphatase MutT [Woeseia sp.]